MLEREIPSICLICGNTAKNYVSNRFGFYCSIRCRFIGERTRYLFGFIFTIVLTGLTIWLALSTNEWYLPTISAILLLFFTVGLLLGRRFLGEKRGRKPNWQSVLLSGEYKVCSNCLTINSLEYSACRRCKRALYEDIRTNNGM